MLSLRVIRSYLQRLSNLAEAAPGFVSGGMAPSLSAIETLPHDFYPNTSSASEFTRLQNEMRKKKKNKRKLDGLQDLR